MSCGLRSCEVLPLPLNETLASVKETNYAWTTCVGNFLNREQNSKKKGYKQIVIGTKFL
jgi:hypothetical protein